MDSSLRNFYYKIESQTLIDLVTIKRQMKALYLKILAQMLRYKNFFKNQYS